MPKPRISDVDPATVKYPAMVAEFDRCTHEGTPRLGNRATLAKASAKPSTQAAE